MSTGNSSEKKNSQPSEIYRRRSKNKNPLAVLILKFISAYTSEQSLNRNQDNREYKLNIYISALTLLFIVLTTVGVFIQAFFLYNTDKTVADNERRSLRAYVSIRNIHLERRSNGYFDIVPEWENSGNSPTVNMTATLSRLAVKDSIPDDVAFGSVTGVETVPFVVGPKAVSNIAFNTISKTCLDQFNRRDEINQFHIWGYAVYDDIFTPKGLSRRQHRTGFCFDINEIVFSADGESARLSYGLCRKGNCTEEDCPDFGSGTFVAPNPPCKPEPTKSP